MLVFKTIEGVVAFFEEQATLSDRAASLSSRTKKHAALNSAQAAVWRDAARALQEGYEPAYDARLAEDLSKAKDALQNIRDVAYFDSTRSGVVYYRKAENALATLECRDAKDRADDTSDDEPKATSFDLGRAEATIEHLQAQLKQSEARIIALEAAAKPATTPGARPCDTCEGTGIIQQCVICGSAEPRTGTCGSSDPRALCNFAPQHCATQAHDPSWEAFENWVRKNYSDPGEIMHVMNSYAWELWKRLGSSLPAPAPQSK